MPTRVLSMVCLAALTALLSAGCSDPTKDLTSSDPKVQHRAVLALAYRGDDAALDALAPLAKGENGDLAAEVLTALSKSPSGRACEVLSDVVLTDKREGLRLVAAVSLGQRKEPEAAETLRRVVGRDPAPGVRGEAAKSLGVVGKIEDATLLANTLVRETDARAAMGEILALQKLTRATYPLYDPKASPDEQQAQLQRIRESAIHQMEVKTGKVHPDIIRIPKGTPDPRLNR